MSWCRNPRPTRRESGGRRGWDRVIKALLISVFFSVAWLQATSETPGPRSAMAATKKQKKQAKKLVKKAKKALKKENTAKAIVHFTQAFGLDPAAKTEALLADSYLASDDAHGCVDNLEGLLAEVDGEDAALGAGLKRCQDQVEAEDAAAAAEASAQEAEVSRASASSETTGTAAPGDQQDGALNPGATSAADQTSGAGAGANQGAPGSKSSHVAPPGSVAAVAAQAQDEALAPTPAGPLDSLTFGGGHLNATRILATLASLSVAIVALDRSSAAVDSRSAAEECRKGPLDGGRLCSTASLAHYEDIYTSRSLVAGGLWIGSLGLAVLAVLADGEAQPKGEALVRSASPAGLQFVSSGVRWIGSY